MSRKRRTIFISLRRLKIHEFDSTIRRVHGSRNWLELFDKLGDLQQRAISMFMKSATPLLAAYLIISSLNSDGKVGVTFQGISASVPTAYLTVVVSFIYLVACLSLAHLIVVMSLRVRQSGKFFIPGLSTNVLGLLQGHEDNALGIPTLTVQFLKEVIPVSVVMGLLFLFAIFGLFIPFFAFGYFISIVQIELISTVSTPIFEKVAAASGLGFVFLSVFYFVLFHVPLPFRKNKSFIRWNFLAPISRAYPHPQSKKWLQ